MRWHMIPVVVVLGLCEAGCWYSAAHLEAESQVSGLGPGFPFGNFYIWELVKQKKLTTILARTFLLRRPLCVNRIPVISVLLVYRTKMCYR